MKKWGDQYGDGTLPLQRLYYGGYEFNSCLETINARLSNYPYNHLKSVYGIKLVL